mgnify:CR=1 FL=1
MDASRSLLADHPINRRRRQAEAHEEHREDPLHEEDLADGIHGEVEGGVGIRSGRKSAKLAV